MNEQNMDMNYLYGIPSCPDGNCGDARASTVRPIEDIASSSNLVADVPSLEDIASFNITGVQPLSPNQQTINPAIQQAQQQQEDIAKELESQLPEYLQNQNDMVKEMMNGYENGVRPQTTNNTEFQDAEVNTDQQLRATPINPLTEPMPLNVASLQYLNGFMRTQIGRIVNVEFLVGSNNLVDKTGILLAVGANYILINEVETDDILACDFYNIKFIRFYY